MSKKTKKLPVKVYVKWQDDGEGGAWLEAGKKPEDIAEFCEETEIGIYELCEVATIENTTRVVGGRNANS